MSFVRLHHGTDTASANHILSHGVERATAARYNGGGEFWATKNVTTADIFARANPAGGAPARFGFDIPEQILLQLVKHRSMVVVHSGDDFEFLPPSFHTLNQAMTNQQVVLIP